jgi:NodT family efflux transporter outer membrane factor (OMF) lipoprotein
MNRQVAAFVCLLPLAACMGPRPAAPPSSHLVAPPTWRAAIGPAAPPEAAWWKAFSDPTLDRLVEQALVTSPDVGQAAARVAQARAQARLARAQRGPEINFQGVGGYTRVLEVVGPITTWGAEPEATVAFDFDLFGRLSSASAAARANLLASEAARDAVALAVASTTASAYIQLLGLDERLRIARETLESRTASLKIARRRAELGYASDLEVRQAEVEYRATAQLLPSIELSIGQQEDAVATLVGDPSLVLTREADAFSRLTAPVIPGGLPSELLRRRPDIVAAEDAVVAADHSLDSVRAAILPNLSLTGSVGEIIADVLPNPQSIFLIGGSVLAPLFDSGRRRAAADTAAGRRDEAAFAYRKTALNAFREVNDGLIAASKLQTQLGELRGQVEAQAGLLRVATDRYRAGYASYLEQVDAERLLLAGHLSLVQVQTQRLVSIVALYEAMGGGWGQGGHSKP